MCPRIPESGWSRSCILCNGSRHDCRTPSYTAANAVANVGFSGMGPVMSAGDLPWSVMWCFRCPWRVTTYVAPYQAWRSSCRDPAWCFDHPSAPSSPASPAGPACDENGFVHMVAAWPGKLVWHASRNRPPHRVGGHVRSGRDDSGAPAVAAGDAGADSGTFHRSVGRCHDQ